MKGKVQIKTPKEIAIMAKGGKKLGLIKQTIKEKVKVGVSAAEIEKLANSLIKKSGGKASFKMVPGYSWATCINVNQGIVHGIPHKNIVFQDKDLVSVDLGLYYQGFHTDTSFTVLIGKDEEEQKFLAVGKKALKKAIKEARVGQQVTGVSRAMQRVVEAAGYSTIKNLVGHGIGRNLHEYPPVPCFVSSDQKRVSLVEGMALAIEVIYAAGGDEVVVGDDGWTVSTKDGKMAGLFEETVSLGARGPVVLT